MRTLSLVSQKGGAGKTTLSLHLAVAAHMAGFSVAIADLDPQVSAWKWSERRKGEPAAIVAQAEQLESIQARAAAGGLDLLIVDSAPHADRPALLACKAADLVLIPCRASIVDVDAIGATFDITSLARKPAAVVFNACNTTTDSTSWAHVKVCAPAARRSTTAPCISALPSPGLSSRDRLRRSWSRRGGRPGR